MADTMRIPPLNSFEDVGAILREICEKQEKTSVSLEKTDQRLNEHAEWRREHAEDMKEIRAILKENAEQMKKHTGEIEEIRAIQRETAESMKETDRRLKETERLIKENSRQMGFVQNKLGEVVEHIVIPNINEKFKYFGYTFGTPQRNVKFFDKNYNLIAEADILMLGDAGFMIGEVKTTLKKEDADNHVKRLETIRNNAAWPPIDGNRKLLGFMAGAIASEDVKEYARQNGLFVAVQSGDTIKLDVPAGFVPKAW
ncbi:MAG: hypothetical protein LBK27_00345 [Treponema sp.]|jgi:hypothetical protein|nr:hypothetical protein [Treponema sp.]